MRRVPTSVIPIYYVYQIQFLMHTLRLKECDFIQYIPAGTWTQETFIVTNKKYDPYFWKAKFPLLRSFWDEVLAIRSGKEMKKATETDITNEITIEIEENERLPEKKKKRRKSTKNAILEITSCLIEDDRNEINKKEIVKNDRIYVPFELQVAAEEMEKNGIPKKERNSKNNNCKLFCKDLSIDGSEDCFISL